MAGALVATPVANAQSTADLQVQIAALLAQIAALQAQLNASTGSGTSVSCSFTRDLTVGSTGTDVKCLQQYLNAKGFVVASSGPGSAGNESSYFGPLTRAALAKWQAANGVAPPAGYFGPITRAKIASLGSSTPGTPGTPGTPAPSSGLAVGLAASNPAGGSLISSASSAAARVPVLAVNLTAGNSSGVTVSQIKFKKSGVLSDSAISGAYLVEDGKVVAQYSSLSGGVITFSSLSLSVAAGQTRTFQLAIDPAQNLSAGNTVGFSVLSSADITAMDATNSSVTPSGSFPLQGNTFTVTSVSNPSIASIAVASSSIGTTVTAGSQNVIVGAWQFTGSNSKTWLKGITFNVIGSATKSDLKNAKLLINGAQFGPTLATVPADGRAHFDLSANPATLNTGANNVQLILDVMGSPSFNFTVQILNAYDVLAVDSEYNVPVAAGSNTGTQVSINQGQITVTTATDTPTGNIAKGQSNVTLAKFAVYAAGEPVKVKWLTFTLAFTGGTGNDLDSYIKNVRLVDDAGNQVGNTITSLTTTVTCTDGGGQAVAPTTARNCFGSSGSQINYIIPANTSRVLSLKGDVQSAADFSNVTAALVAGSGSNLQGMTSSQTSNSGAASASALSLAANALTVAKNTAVGTQVVAKGATNRKIGSYSLSASSAEGVTVSNLTVTTSASSTNFQNLKVMVNGSQFGNTQGVLSASGAYSFSGTPFTIAAGQTVYVDVYADVLSSTTANTYTAVTTLSGCSASGAVSFSAISCTSTAGHDVTVAGQTTLQVALDNNATSAAGQIVMGNTGVKLAAFRFTETTNIEDVKITDLIIFDQVVATTTKSAFSNLKLYNGSDLNTALATAGSANTAASTSNPGPGYYYQFNFASPVVVPQGQSVTLVLKGDVASYASSGASDNTTHIFKISSSTDSANDTIGETVVALGNTSNATSAVSKATGAAAPNGNQMTVLRSKLTASAAAIGSASGRSKSATDDFANLTFTADAAGTVAVNSVIVTFSGTAPSIGTFLDGVTLLDANGSNVTNTSGVAVTTSSACDGTNTCTKTWNLGSTTGGWTVNSSGYTFKLRIDSTKTLAGASGVAQSLTATINANTDVRYTDGLDSAATSVISLPSNAVPLNLNSVSYAAGS